MAVVSISRIQVRRGTALQGTGLPQLASGEFGWAIDTQELYIGNGSTAEGAPAVGNTQILTSNTSILDIPEQYKYRANDNIETSEGAPVIRTIAARLDDRVSIRAFGGENTDTDQLQKALLELYLKNPDPKSAPILHVEPGEYVITRTIYVPPYTTIKGAGKNKTVFTKTGEFDMFRTISKNVSYNGTLASVNETEVVNKSLTAQDSDQAQYIRFEDLTLKALMPTSYLNSNTLYLLRLDNCGESEFKNVLFDYIEGSNEISTLESGIGFDSENPALVSKNNKFIDCEFRGLKEAAHSLRKTDGNKFIRCEFTFLDRGVVLGAGLVAGENGPSYNAIIDSKVDNINKHVFLVPVGKGNRSKNNRYGVNVSKEAPGYPIVSYGERGNFSVDDTFERTYNYAMNGNLNEKYYPEVEGPVFYTNGGYQTLSLTNGNASVPLRLPADTSKAYSVEYFFKNDIGTLFRSGVLHVLVDLGSNLVTVSNDYNESSSFGGPNFTGEIQLNPTDPGDVWAAKLLVTEPSSVGNLTVKITSKS